MSTYLRLCKHLKNIKDLQANAIVQLQLISKSIVKFIKNNFSAVLNESYREVCDSFSFVIVPGKPSLSRPRIRFI